MRELSLSILDLIQNSVRHGATLVDICITEDACENRLDITVKDNGCGMSAEAIRNITDPFYTTCITHKVGLGVPLFAQRAYLTGGGFEINAEEGSGAVVSAWFCTKHIDFVPLGDMSKVLLCAVASTDGVDFVYTYRNNYYEFELDTKQLFSKLGVDSSFPLSYKVALVKEYLADEIIQ